MRIGLSHARARAIFTRVFKASLDAVDPYAALRRDVTVSNRILRAGPHRYRLSNYRRIVAIGAGKASARMALGLERVLGPVLEGGLVVVKDGHGAPTRAIEIVEAGHPVPDRRGWQAGRRILDLVRTLTKDDLLIVLLSGGASSLLPAPAEGLTLEHKQQTTQLLLRSGATIHEINTVRKHLSVLKGGQLAAATNASVLTLLVSDVIGDDLGTIGSGPTAPDDTTFGDAWTIIRHYRLERTIPAAVRRRLVKGSQGGLGETPDSGAALFRRVHHHIIGGNAVALTRAARIAASSGLQTMVLTSTLTGEAKEVAKVFGAFAREIAGRGQPVPRPCCLLAGGELTVTVSGKGRGGRAQEFALAGALEIQGLRNVWLAGFGTDGTDGPTDAAGAVVGGDTFSSDRQTGQEAVRALRDHDAYTFFQQTGGHIITGPTGSNVNDLYLLVAL